MRGSVVRSAFESREGRGERERERKVDAPIAFVSRTTSHTPASGLMRPLCTHLSFLALCASALLTRNVSVTGFSPKTRFCWHRPGRRSRSASVRDTRAASSGDEGEARRCELSWSMRAPAAMAM